MLKPIINFHWWGLPIYFVAMIIGLLAGLLMLRKQQNGTVRGKILLLVSIILSYASANIACWFMYPSVIYYPFAQKLLLGGMNIYVGILAFFGLSALFRLRKGVWKQWIHEAVPAVALFAFFERVGCSLAGYCYGREVVIDSFSINTLFPAREIEALVLLVMTIVFSKMKSHRLYRFILSYSVLRFTIEFGRADDRGRLFVDFLSPTQIISIAGLLFSIVWLIVYKLTKKESPVFEPREKVEHKHANRNYLLGVVCAVMLIFAWVNPLNIYSLNTLKQSISDFTYLFNGERSVVTVLSESSATNAIKVKSDTPISDEKAALMLLSSYDVELGGEFAFVEVISLSSGNKIYNFTQTHDGIPIYGTGKQLVADTNDNALYILGTTQMGIDGISTPNDLISTDMATKSFNDYLNGIDVSVLSTDLYWHDSPGTEGGAMYHLTYAIASVFGDIRFTIFVDALTGNVVDMMAAESNATLSAINDSFKAVSDIIKSDYLKTIMEVESGDAPLDLAFVYAKDISIKHYTGLSYSDNSGVQILNRIFADILKSKAFEPSDFETIVTSANEVAALLSDANFWIYKDILMSECEAYYKSKGETAKKQVTIITSAFSKVGINDSVPDTSVVSVDVKDTPAFVNGHINFPYNRDYALFTQAAGTTREYTIKTEVPINVTITNSSGEVVLMLPVYDEETFEIYPTDMDEKYTVAIQAGNNFLSTKSQKSVTPTLTATVLLTMPSISIIENTLQANYSIAVSQMKQSSGASSSSNAIKDKVQKAFNSGNGHSFLGLYRYDNLKSLYDQNGILSAAFGAEFADQYMTMLTQGASFGMQMLLASYKTYNTTIKSMADQASDPEYKAGLMKLWSDNPDKTVMALFLFAEQIADGSFPAEKLMRLNDTTLTLRIAGESETSDKTKIRLRASLSGGYSATHEITLTKQYFNSQGNVIPYDESVPKDFFDGVSKLFSSAGEYLVWDAETSSQRPIGAYINLNVNSPIYFDCAGMPYNTSSVTVQSNVTWNCSPTPYWCEIKSNGDTISFELWKNHGDQREVDIEVFAEDESGKEVSGHIKVIQRDQYFDGGVLYIDSNHYELYMTKKQAQDLYRVYDWILTKDIVKLITGIDLDKSIGSNVMDKAKGEIKGFLWDALAKYGIEGIAPFLKVMELNGMIPTAATLWELNNAIKKCDDNGYVVVRRNNFLGGVSRYAHNDKIDPSGGFYTPTPELDDEYYFILQQGGKG